MKAIAESAKSPFHQLQEVCKVHRQREKLL